MLELLSGIINVKRLTMLVVYIFKKNLITFCYPMMFLRSPCAGEGDTGECRARPLRALGRGAGNGGVRARTRVECLGSLRWPLPCPGGGLTLRVGQMPENSADRSEGTALPTLLLHYHLVCTDFFVSNVVVVTL